MSKRKAFTVCDTDKKRDTEKLKRFLIAAIAVLAVTALILLTVFLVDYLGEQHFSSKDGGGTITNHRTGITYKMVVPCPYTVNIDFNETYGELDGAVLYKILYMDTAGNEQFFDPEKMIATVDEYNNVELYLAEGFTLPKLDELNPTHGRAYFTGVQQVAAGTLSEDDVKKVVNTLKNGENAPHPTDIDDDSYLNLYLIDAEHPEFWYTVEYFETLSGEIYIRDTALGKRVKATNELKELFKTESEA